MTPEPVEEADITNDALALVVFHHPCFVDFVFSPFVHPTTAFIEELEEADLINALSLVVFQHPPPEYPAAFIEEVEESDVIDDTLALVVFHRPPF